MSTHNEALHKTLSKGPATGAALRKSLDMDEHDFDNFIADAKARLWIDEDTSGKTVKYSLSDTGQRALDARYASEADA